MFGNPYALIVDGYLEDFQGGIEVLASKPSEAIHDQAAEVLCEMARDIMFSLGSARDYDPNYVRQIISLFETAAGHINRRTAELAAFSVHIASRAKLLKAELANPKPSQPVRA